MKKPKKQPTAQNSAICIKNETDFAALADPTVEAAKSSEDTESA